jgi:tetratricopeptide (TPR) repeat protein
VDEAPDVPEYWQVLASGYSGLGVIQLTGDRFAEGEKNARQYLHWAEKLAAASPDEPKYQVSLANAHNDLGEAFNHTGRLPEAEIEYRQAIALAEKALSRSPTNWGPRNGLVAFTHNLGEVLIKSGRPEQAESPYLRAVALAQRLAEDDPSRFPFGLAFELSCCADLYQELGRWQDAIDAGRKALDLAKLADADAHRRNFGSQAQLRNFGSQVLSQLLGAHYKLVFLLQAAGRQDKARAERDPVIARLAKAIELKPDDVALRYFYALAQAEAGDLTGYRNACAAMLDRFGRTENPDVADRVAWTLGLAPDAVKDLDQAVKLAEMAVRNDSKNKAHPLTLGSALYRAGRFGEAIVRLNETSADQGQAATNLSSPIYAWFFLAMAHHRLGHAEESRKWLDKARKRAEQEIKNPSNGGFLTWNRRVTWQLLRREAEALLRKSEAGPDKPKATEKPQGKTANH